MKKKTKEMNEEANGKCKSRTILLYTLIKSANQSLKDLRLLDVLVMLRKENGHSVDDETKKMVTAMEMEMAMVMVMVVMG